MKNFRRIKLQEADGPTSVLVRKDEGKSMKTTYIKKVKHNLLCSAKQKKEVLRDLEEIFSSAAEHGESEMDVIARLGTAKDYAAAMDEGFGVDRKAALRRRALMTILPPALLAPVFWLLYRIARPFSFSERMSVGIICGADGPTSILITTSPASPYAAPVLLALCLLCTAAAVAALVIHYIRRRKK